MFYEVYIDIQDWYAGEFKKVEQEYFKDLKNAYLWCREIAEECGNDCDDFETFEAEMKDYGVATIGQFTVEKVRFKDEAT